MKVILSSATSYAYILQEDLDKRQTQKLEKASVRVGTKWESLKGLRIEISPEDLFPDDVKPKLVEGKFFVIE